MKEVNCAQSFSPSRPHACERALWPETLSPAHGRSFRSLCPDRSSRGFLEILDLSFCWPAEPCTPSRPGPAWSTNCSVCELVKARPQSGYTGKEHQKHVPSPWQWAQALPTPGATPGQVNGAAGRMRYDASSLPWHTFPLWDQPCSQHGMRMTFGLHSTQEVGAALSLTITTKWPCCSWDQTTRLPYHIHHLFLNAKHLFRSLG